MTDLLSIPDSSLEHPLKSASSLFPILHFHLPAYPAPRSAYPFEMQTSLSLSLPLSIRVHLRERESESCRSARVHIMLYIRGRERDDESSYGYINSRAGSVPPDISRVVRWVGWRAGCRGFLRGKRDYQRFGELKKFVVLSKVELAKIAPPFQLVEKNY